MRDDEPKDDGEQAGHGDAADGGGGRGWARGLGILSAFKDAMEETINEARERGDLSAERAREILGSAAHRAREATTDARDRFDFASRADIDALARRVAALEARVRDRLGGSGEEEDATHEGESRES